MSGDVLVIGAGVGGLVAATYLAKSGAKVTVLEAGAEPGGVCADTVRVGPFAVAAGPMHLTALDPQVIKDLQLTERGLRFAVRDLALIGWREGGELELSRNRRKTERSLAAHSQKDAARYAVFRRELFSFARAMRRVWWENGAAADGKTLAMAQYLQVTSAAALLEARFESEALRAAFAFDALQVSPAAAGSALVLAWAMAQEMCGLQAAAALPAGGPASLVEALVAAAAAAGVVIRCGAKVARLELDGEAVRGAVLDNGETIPALTILSGLTRRRTLVELLPPGAAGFSAACRLSNPVPAGEARIVLALASRPAALARDGRYVVAERLETAVLAYAEAAAGLMPADPALEAVVVDSGSPPQVLLSVTVRPLPVTPVEGWAALSARLIPSVVHTLERHIPGLAAAVTGIGFVPPEPADPLSPADLLAPWPQRLTTPVRGLYLCGAAGEPVPAICGRAGRLAAGLVLAQDKEARP